MIPNMTYWAARDHIKDGDTILIWRKAAGDGFIPSIFRSLLQFFTGSPVFHCAQAVWVETGAGTRRLMCVEANVQSRRIIPLSYYADYKLEVVPLPEGSNFEGMDTYAMQRVATEKYGFWNLLTIAAREFFRFPPKSVSGQVCSEFSAYALREAGVDLGETVISPGRLRTLLLKYGMKPTIVINGDR